MKYLGFLWGVAFAAIGQDAFAKNRLTDPVKIARECKSEVEQFCKDMRPGKRRVIACLKKKAADLSPACSSALRSTE
jgi:Cysteine rich repeat